MVIHITPRPLFRILPTRHIITLTKLVCRIGLIRINITHAPNLITIIYRIISTHHRVNGDSPPPSSIFNQLDLLIHLVHNIFKIHTQFHLLKIENHQSWKWVCVSPNNNHKIWRTHNAPPISKQHFIFSRPIATKWWTYQLEKMLEAMTQAQNARNHDIDRMI